ncbi:MAG: HAD family hydrolase [Verrucomicrobia bacterium]|nr:HAD family hydrolase [Verrucomicrobiota bacterium]
MKSLLQRIQNLSSPLEPIPTGTIIDLHPIDGVETILFDIYGTLLISGSGDVGTAAATDSGEALTQSLIVSGYAGDLERAGELGPALMKAEIARWHETARDDGIEFPEVEISRVWKKTIEKFHRLELLKPDDDPQRILQLAVEYECRVNPVWPMPGALETIAFLKKRGFRLGIVSNAQFYTPLIIEALFGKSVEALGFDPALCVWSYKKHHAKPSGELFQCLETDFSKTLYVGNDMLNDIWTATEAGCRTVLFAGDQRSLRLREQDKRCKKLTPTAIVDDLRQITEMV